jgi:hypothetical protein
MMIRRICLALISCAVLWGQLGCATQEVWEGAKRDVWTYEGVVRSVDEATGRSRLVVRYGGWGVSDVFVSIPLDASGAPPAALVYAGKARLSRKINADLPAIQSDAVARFALSSPPSGDAGDARHADDSNSIIFCYLSDFRIVGVALGNDGSPLAGNLSSVSNDAVSFPQDCRILLLPSRIPRSVEERRASAARAAVLTPAALVIDAALIPVGVVYQIFNGR